VTAAPGAATLNRLGEIAAAVKAADDALAADMLQLAAGAATQPPAAPPGAGGK
jgi:hypothetical protein